MEDGIENVGACRRLIETHDTTLPNEFETSAGVSAGAKAAMSKAEQRVLEKATAEALQEKTDAAATTDAAAAARIGDVAEDRAAAAAAIENGSAAVAAIESVQDQAIADVKVKDDALVQEAARETIAGIDTTTDAPIEVTPQTPAEQNLRFCEHEFRIRNAGEFAERAHGQTTEQSAVKDGVPSHLQRAGLLALGAAVVGAVLLNGQRVLSQTGDRVVVVDGARCLHRPEG